MVQEAMRQTPQSESTGGESELSTEEFFLRKQLGSSVPKSTAIFLNHRRFIRSEYEGAGIKSLRELMTGQSHPHWLELLYLSASNKHNVKSAI